MYDTGGVDFIAWLKDLLGKIFVTESSCEPVSWRTTKGGIWYMGSPAHIAWQASRVSTMGPWGRIFGFVSKTEGATSAYQNYDNQIVTLGAGFGAKGLLYRVARLLNIPSVIPLPDNGNKYSDALLSQMKTQSFGEKYVCMAESSRYREPLLKAQIEAFRAAKERYHFPENNVPLTYLLSHMSHWYPAGVPEGGWTGNDAVDVPRLLSEFPKRLSGYGITPKPSQIEHYLTKYRSYGGQFSGHYERA